VTKSWFRLFAYENKKIAEESSMPYVFRNNYILFDEKNFKTETCYLNIGIHKSESSQSHEPRDHSADSSNALSQPGAFRCQNN